MWRHLICYVATLLTEAAGSIPNRRVFDPKKYSQVFAFCSLAGKYKWTFFLGFYSHRFVTRPVVNVLIHLEPNPSTRPGWEFMFATDKEEIRCVYCACNQDTNSSCKFCNIFSSDGRENLINGSRQVPTFSHYKFLYLLRNYWDANFT